MRLLGAALGDDGAARRLIGAALHQAGRKEMPRHPDELIAFVRAYLVTTLTDRLGVRPVSTLLDELLRQMNGASSTTASSASSARVQRPFASDPRFEAAQPRPPSGSMRPPTASSGEQRATSHHNATPRPSTVSEPIDDGSRPSASRMSALSADRPASVPKIAAAPQATATSITRDMFAPIVPRVGSQSSKSNPALEALAGQPTGAKAQLGVLVIDPDRYGRAAIARALVQASCDVVVIDTATDLATLSGTFDVLVATLSSPEVLRTVAALAVRFSDIPCVARTREDTARVKEQLEAMGLRSVYGVDAALPTSLLVDRVRRAALR